MRVILTSLESFKAKDGVEYTKGHYLNPANGRTGQIFAKKSVVDGFKLPSDRVASDLVEKLGDCEVTDVDFDERGGLVALR